MKEKRYKAIVFDLDGTLTDTLKDLMISTNYALRQMGWEERSLEEVRQFVGNGVRRLIEQAVPEGVSENDFERCFAIFKDYYVVHCQDNTGLYDGIKELLQELHRREYLIAIVSNKLQAGVDELYETYFHDTVTVAIGEQPPVPRKPDAAMVRMALERLGVTEDEAVYIGDSDVDLLTARNSNLPCISVLWGFRDKDFLEEHGATTFVTKPNDILDIV